LIAGKRVARITGVSTPTITFYKAPAQKNTGLSVVVFPGGGYRILAYDLEGTEVCGWLNSIGANCVLLKYRVPNAGPFPEHPEDLADAQRAVRLTRQHAAEWKLNPDRVGVLGFSAGGHLAAALSNHSGEAVYKASDAADQLSAKPNFVFMIYPGLLLQPDLTNLRAEVVPSSATPPTFLVQAENDPVHVENTTAYFAALKAVKATAEMHVYSEGGHGYGLRPTKLPITKWPKLAEEWLRTIGMLSQ
jgi:acetyl esterase/lipase